MFRTARRALSTALARHWQHATLLEGVVPELEGAYRCLLVEDRGFTEYIRPRLYPSGARTVARRRVSLAGLRTLIQTPPRDLDLCIAILPAPWEEKLRDVSTVRTTEWVRQIIDLSHLPPRSEERMHKKARAAEGRIQRHGLECRISRDRADLEHFYRDMYLPHIRAQFGEGAIVDGLEEMDPYFARGCVLFVLHGGQAVAGALVHFEGNTLIWRRSGILRGDKEYVRMGAQAALYYFTIDLARTRALDRVDLMKSRPFFQDGVFAHKREWGAAVHTDLEADAAVLYFPLHRLEGFAAFVERNPMVVTTGKGLMALVGSTAGLGEASARIQRDLDHYQTPGLEGLLIQTSEERLPSEFDATRPCHAR